MPRRKSLHKLGCGTPPKPRCLLYYCGWLKSQFQTAHLLYSTSGQGLWTPGNAAGKTPGEDRGSVLLCLYGAGQLWQPWFTYFSRFCHVSQGTAGKGAPISASSRIWFVSCLVSHRKLQGYTRRNKILAPFRCLFCFLKMRADRFEFVSKQSCHMVRF